MAILSTIFLVLAIIVAIVFSLLVLITGKGDAMSGGGSVRTTYKGKATFDDIMSRATLGFGVAFMVLVLLYNVAVSKSNNAPLASTPAVSTPVTPPVTNNTPAANNSTASNNTAASNNTVANNAPASGNNAPVGGNTASNNGPASMPTANTPAGNTPPAGNNATASNNAPK